LVTDKVDEWYAFLQARGVEFDQAPALNDRYHIYHCFLRDPNGYLIEIQQFLDPEWPG
jgi:catechol 2,3-dioxygenase-like lactoylglutathione lyase family enzyme